MNRSGTVGAVCDRARFVISGRARAHRARLQSTYSRSFRLCGIVDFSRAFRLEDTCRCTPFQWIVVVYGDEDVAPADAFVKSPGHRFGQAKWFERSAAARKPPYNAAGGRPAQQRKDGPYRKETAHSGHDE